VLCLAAIQNVIPANRVAYAPGRSRFDDRVVCTIVLNGLCFMTKLDKRAFSPSTRSVLLNGRDVVRGPVKIMSYDELYRMKEIKDRMDMSGRMRA
jgi:hypothetical protein